MGVRSSLSALLASTTLSGPARVSLSALSVAEQLSGPLRISGSYGLAAQTLAGANRASGHYLMIARSINYGFELIRLESSSDIDKFHGFGVKGFDISLVQAPAPEHNPYRPTIPESIVDTMGTEAYDYLKENQEITREQHNLTQAGDSTFPYQLMIKPHDVAQYRLGAVSRFYHEDYGIIHARYVKFSQMAQSPFVAAPVGLVQKKKGQVLTWEVTNDLSKSSAQLAVGVLACYTLPTEGQFGWVIVDGPNLQQIGNESPEVRLGQTLAWSSTGRVSSSAVGRIIGRRVFRSSSSALLGGYVHIELESLSEGDIAALIAADTKTLSDNVTSLLDQVATLNQLTNAANLGRFEKDLKILQQKLGLEQAARTSSDRALGNRIDAIDAVSQATLDNAVITLTNFINTSQATQDTAIASIRELALEALLAASAVGTEAIVGLQAQIDAILANLAALNNRVKGKFPVVDGAVPPNLVYLDDGLLVYTETF